MTLGVNDVILNDFSIQHKAFIGHPKLTTGLSIEFLGLLLRVCFLVHFGWTKLR